MSICRARIAPASLLVTLILSVGLSEAKADFGIIITETILMPVGDPLTQYDFKLSLAANNQIQKGDNITLLNIPNYNGQSSYVYMSGGFDYSQFFAITPGEGITPGTTSLSLTFTAPPPLTLTNLTMNSMSIGDLIVVTNVEYPPASNSPLFNPILYNTQTHLNPSGVVNVGLLGVAPSPAAVPEPSSWAMLGVGFVALGLLARGRRGRPCLA